MVEKTGKKNGGIVSDTGKNGKLLDIAANGRFLEEISAATDIEPEEKGIDIAAVLMRAQERRLAGKVTQKAKGKRAKSNRELSGEDDGTTIAMRMDADGSTSAGAVGDVGKKPKAKGRTRLPLPEGEDGGEKYARKLRKMLAGLFVGVDAARMYVIDPMIDNFVFCTVSLYSLQDEIRENGFTEDYQNGENQKGRKKSAAADVYNTLLKNYIALEKQLAMEIPVRSGRDELEEFMSGVGK